MNALLLAIALPLGGGSLIGYITALRGGFRNNKLQKPSWQPPDWVFGPVWTILYIMMGIASWLLWRALPSTARSVALALYATQLALNFAWTPVFTSGHIKTALGVLIALDIAVLALLGSSYAVSGWATALLIPYVIWLGVATSLNVYYARNIST